jgi:hypothetical protein
VLLLLLQDSKLPRVVDVHVAAQRCCQGVELLV